MTEQQRHLIKMLGATLGDMIVDRLQQMTAGQGASDNEKIDKFAKACITKGLSAKPVTAALEGYTGDIFEVVCKIDAGKNVTYRAAIDDNRKIAVTRVDP